MPDDAVFAGSQEAKSPKKAQGRRSDPLVASPAPSHPNDTNHTKGTNIPSSLLAVSKTPHPTFTLSTRSSTEFPSLSKAVRSVPAARQEVHPDPKMAPQREILAKSPPLGKDDDILSSPPMTDDNRALVATRGKAIAPAKYHAVTGTSTNGQHWPLSRNPSNGAEGGNVPSHRNDTNSWAEDDAIASVDCRRPFPSSDSGAGYNRHQSSGGFRGARNGGIRPRRTDWWRRDPHPMFSPKYAAQRLLIEFPLAISVAHAKAVLEKHFEKYGAVHSVYHYDQTGDRCYKGFVVFEDPVSIQRVFSDPLAKVCDLTPDPDTAESRVDITIRPSAASDLERIVLIRVTGSRSPEEARDRRQAHHKQYDIEHRDRYEGAPSQRYDSASSINADGLALVHKELLPERVNLDQIPFKVRTKEHHKLFSSVCVRQISTSWEEFARQVEEGCGRRPVNIREISVRHSSEHEFIPQLCDHLGEVCSLRQPSDKFPGWLVTVSGSRDGRHMIHELQKIPGFFVRWADERDGLFSDDPSATTLKWPSHSNAHRPLPQDRSSPSPSDPVIHTPTTPHATIPSSSSLTILGPSPTHPTLRRALWHSYRGRTLVQDNASGEARFLDESAVFVGRVNKDMESNASLQTRFGKYGRIICLEFNPRGVAQHVNHATARVMYDNRQSAADAIAGENGAHSFGSYLRCELRKVTQSDVHTRAIYVDANNRPLSPADVAKAFPDPNQSFPNPAIVDIKVAPSPESTAAPPKARQSPLPSAPFDTLSPYNSGYPYDIPLSPQFPGMMQGQNERIEAQMGAPSLGLSVMAVPNFDPSAILSFNSMWGLSQPNGVPALQPVYANGSGPASRSVSNTPPAHRVPKPDEKDTPITTPATPSQDIPFATIAKIIKPNSHNLTPVGFKEENGIFTAIYADDELKSYCEKNGLPYPPERHVTPKKEDGQAKLGPAWRESLLPIQTGGHDPASISPMRRGSEAAISKEDRPTLTKLRLRRSRSDYSLDTRLRDGDVSEAVSSFGSSRVPSPRGLLSNHHPHGRLTPTGSFIDDPIPGHHVPYVASTPADMFQFPSLVMSPPPPPVMPQNLIPIPIPVDTRASPADELGRMGPPYISSHYPIYDSLSSSGSSGPAGCYLHNMNGHNASIGYPSMMGYDVYAHQMAVQQQQHAMAMGYQYTKQPPHGGREGPGRENWGGSGFRGNGGDVHWAEGNDSGNGAGNMRRNDSSIKGRTNNYGSMRGKGKGGRRRGQLYQGQQPSRQQAQTEFAEGD
ncbi:hypothetical protein L202_06925 [Cryptococcus amylolentus CBS 6039]|uniref:RRM domain-containing protein n=1 Tax=Cryptococcus amylolentus CBS 6039 TaxID=1295533 RepID=A0A1E3HDZ8_9TREE|nr:hypothetical protein L202_06925 [Cryptococcus amylolentus CBS 6039]ODN74558.1 hypothetical protein L202_06925 [Cryptococcus amylolentus CBS 6039]